ncbi:ribonuclease Z, mitochondrial [Osmia bicornis bicornis]|uniref:ribonuclease Z, mitochondrial n=1 Tax=Osmia bicornis bicornis TaxID=1437191 RepID=UPI0010F9DBD9|nr:ribonuclease Z, mitochondrial [Osmia bicornis bicornis]
MFQLTKYFYKYFVRNTHTQTELKKKSKNITELYKRLIMKQKKQLKLLTTFNNSAKLQVVGSGAPGIPAFMFFTTDQVHYLFNCGEGTQRLCQEHRCKLSKIDHIFITNLSWRNVGGLPGLMLTAQDNGTTNLCIHSPEGIENLVHTVQSFINLPRLKITYPSVNESEPFKDHMMTVRYVPLTKNTEKNVSDENEYDTNENGKRPANSVKNGEKKIKGTPKIICYICEIHPKRGKLLIDKCLQLGIENGPIRNLLKSGKNVTKEDGSVVYSKDVSAPDGPKLTFMVVECPDEEYIDSLVNHPAFLKHQQQALAEENHIAFSVFHFTPEKILNDQRYQNWIEKFSSQTQHVILNDENSCMGSEAVHKNQYLLHMLHPEIFPLLSKDCFRKDKETQKDSIYRARAIQVFKIRPDFTPLTNNDIYQAEESYIEEVLKIDELENTLKEVRANIEKKTEELNLTNISSYPRIVMLGTGCSVPSKVRNTSGILLRIDENTSILLDCGEGTLGQIIRFYGFSESDNILRTIKAVYVSHMHADHHLGLIGLLDRRKQITDEKLYLLVPTYIIPWLNFYNQRFESISQQYIIINNYDLYLNAHQLAVSSESLLYNVMNVSKIDTIFVNHCKHAFGISITLKDNKKIVYSGDTMFCPNLIKLGENCDLLIHEATMDDGRESMAKRKLHSTTSEAIKAGKYMNAKFTLLTHFSQRYSKIPALPKEEANVGLAYDYMEVKLPQLPLLPLFYPCLKVMFNAYNKVIDS